MRNSPWLVRGLAAAAAGMAALVYLNALPNPFVYDDFRTVVENASIRNLLDLRAIILSAVFRPVVNFTYALDFALFGLVPFGYHLTNLLLHAANVVLLFTLTRRLVCDGWTMSVVASVAHAPAGAGGTTHAEGRDEDQEPGDREDGAAFAAGAIYAVHPMMTQAVGFVSGRAEVLCAFFLLAALLAVHEWLMGGRRGWLVLSLACWGLAFASKEVAVMLLFVLVAYDGLILSRTHLPARQRLARIYGPMLVVVAVVGALRLSTFVLIENAGRARFVWSNALVSLDVVRRYVSLMFLPNKQSIIHTVRVVDSPTDPFVLFNLTWLMSLAILAWKLRRREPVVTFGTAWFLLMLVPSAMMLLVGVGEPMAEQRVYLAGCGFAMAVGTGFGRLREWPRRRWMPVRVLAIAALGVLLISLAARTVARNQVWRDPVRLWSEAVSYAPDFWMPYRGLADALREQGDYGRAIQAYQEALRLNPEEAATYPPLGVCLLLTGRLQEAESAFSNAARLAPRLVIVDASLGTGRRPRGQIDQIRDCFLHVIKDHPDALLPRQYLAVLYEREYADPTAALQTCREIASLEPETPGVADCIRRTRQGAASGRSR